MPALRKFVSAWYRVALFAVLLFAGWMFLRAQPAPDPSRLEAHMPVLGSHTLLGQENEHGANPAITAAIATQPAGSSFLVFNAGFASNSATPTDSKENLWKKVGRSVVYRGYDARFDVTAYVSLAGKGGSGHTVRIAKDGEPKGELTLPFIEIRNADVLKDVATNYPPAGPTLTSDSVTTTAPATLIAVWWGDSPSKVNTAEPGDGFTVIESLVTLPEDSAVQCVVAYKEVDRPGTYQVTWTNTPEQSAPLWLLAFQSSAVPPSPGAK